MVFLKIILGLSSFLFTLFVVLCILDLDSPSNKEGARRPFVLLAEIARTPFWYVICLLVLVSGLTNIILRFAAAKPEIGAFYEKKNYTQAHEACISSINGKDSNLYCIMDISRWTDHGNSYYTLKAIHLPHNRVYHLGEDIDPFDSDCTISINDVDCTFQIYGAIDENSENLLQSYVVSSNGNYCVEKNHDIVHSIDCYLLLDVKSNSLRHFNILEEAFLFGYFECPECLY